MNLEDCIETPTANSVNAGKNPTGHGRFGDVSDHHVVSNPVQIHPCPQCCSLPPFLLSLSCSCSSFPSYSPCASLCSCQLQCSHYAHFWLLSVFQFSHLFWLLLVSWLLAPPVPDTLAVPLPLLLCFPRMFQLPLMFWLSNLMVRVASRFTSSRALLRNCLRFVLFV